MNVSTSQKLQLDLLRTLGVPNDQVGEIRDQLHKTDQLAVNGNNQVALGTLERAARAVEAHLAKAGQRFVPLPTETLRALLAPVSGDTLQIELGAPFPEPQTRLGEAVEHPAQLDVAVQAKALGQDAEAVARLLGKVAPNVAADLEAGRAKLADLAKALGTEEGRAALGPKLDVVMSALGKLGGPGHTSQDVQVDLSSKYSHLDGSSEAGQIGVFQKRSLQYLTVKRDKTKGQFSLHGFERDKVVVTVPPGATVIMLDGAGNQTGARMRPKPQTIDGAKHSGVEISRSLVQHPDRQMYETNPRFGVRVIDKSGAVLYERKMTFDRREAHTSKRILTGSFEAQPSPDAALAELWDNYQPDGRNNPAPVGERPRFTVDGQSGDRLRLMRDGKNMDVARLVQLLAPPKSATQAFKVDKRFVQLESRNTSEKELDAPDYDPTVSGRLRGSDSRGITFDRSLSQTRQAHWGSRGLRIFEIGMRKVLGTFDPVHDAR